MTAAILDPKLNNHLSALSDDFKSSMDEYLSYERGSLLRNKYKFLSNLQNGSFGKVTCGLDLINNRKVAIKSLKKSIPGISFMARHEISIMKKIGNHENVCQLIECFETKKFIILVLEFIECGDLYDAIHNQTELGYKIQNDSEYFIGFFSQLVEVINYSHSKGVYHRDIKPENILLTADGTIKLCDWGLSTHALNCKDFNVGTEKYMSPESLNSSNDFYNAKKSDVWSLGITLLFTLFGKCPFRKANMNDLNYLSFLKNKEYLFDYYPNINTLSFDVIVNKLLIDRDLSSAYVLVINNGLTSGFNLDQEFKLHQLVKNAAASTTQTPSDNDIGGEFFMFDQEQEFDSTNNNATTTILNDDIEDDLSLDDTLSVENTVIKPIEIKSTQNHYASSLKQARGFGATFTLQQPPLQHPLNAPISQSHQVTSSFGVHFNPSSIHYHGLSGAAGTPSLSGLNDQPPSLTNSYNTVNSFSSSSLSFNNQHQLSTASSTNTSMVSNSMVVPSHLNMTSLSSSNYSKAVSVAPVPVATNRKLTAEKQQELPSLMMSKSWCDGLAEDDNFNDALFEFDSNNNVGTTANIDSANADKNTRFVVISDDTNTGYWY